MHKNKNFPAGKSLRFILLFFILFSMIMVQFQFAETKKLTHEMSDWERALMPEYLKNLPKQLRAAPPTPVRNIAEFDKMEGVLIRYPFGISTALIKEMAEDVMVTTIVTSSSQEQTVRSTYTSAGVNLSHCNFMYAPSDSYWTRDYGPWYVHDGTGNVNIVDFTYNRPRPNDNNIPTYMATFLGVSRYFMDLEQAGGNYMTDGLGISVSTDLVWEENSDKTQTQIRQLVQQYLGIDTYHVTADPLGDYIKHVDCWGKYLDVDKILITQVPTSNTNYQKFENTATYFSNQTSAWGNKYQVYRVYSPSGQPYTNSLILNNKVLVPITGSSADSGAIASYQAAMPGYEVLGFTGSWETTDALHCRTKGVPDRKMVYIEHMPILGNRSTTQAATVTATIIPYSKAALNASACKVYYRVNGGSYTAITMTNTSSSTYSATIPSQTSGAVVGYYIAAADTQGNSNKHPFIGAADPHTYTSAGGGCTADFTYSINNLFVQFNDQSTSDGGSVVSWMWNFGDGTTSTLKNPGHNYVNPGTYSVNLSITDSNSYTDSIAKSITLTIPNDTDSIIGVFTGSVSGLWQVDNTGSAFTWTRLSLQQPDMIRMGDVDGNGKDDLGCFFADTDKFWIRYDNGNWVDVPASAKDMICFDLGDINNDGYADIVGSWTFGTWWKNTANGVWTKLSNMSPTYLACGDFDGDGYEDIVGLYPTLSSLWIYKYNGSVWTRISYQINLNDLRTGDFDNDGKDEVLGSWNIGTWTFNPTTNVWIKHSNNQASVLCAGDINGLNKDDILGNWSPSAAGVWVKYLETGVWSQLSKQIPTDITSGKTK
jgi:agmatine/peptidylarginine deiminase